MERFFRYVNLLPMPLWLAMMLAPNHPLTERASRSSAIFSVTALNYLLALVAALRRGRSQDNAAVDFTTLEGVRGALSTPEGALGAWTHMLALDLFTGAWIYRQCRRLGAPAWVRVPALFFTLLSGPFGLLLFLAWRVFGGRQQEALPSLANPAD